MKAKLITLIIGGLLVTFGSRWLIESIATGWFATFGVLLMFLVGQWLVRFEDYPNGEKQVARLNDWLNR